MILSSLDNRQTLALLRKSAAFGPAFDWLTKHALTASDGITELQGASYYVNVHGYDTQAREACRWESHRQTVDLQFCISGGERIDWASHQPLGLSSVYNPQTDTDIWPGELCAEQTFVLRSGCFVIFLPGELHRPMITDDENGSTRKLVVKIPGGLLTT
ncbi:MAG: YhcH/YjgK/YiaL family protein [Verrucomicrobia bacterium]|nr:YhcH/YjgK/YiaL family protein [Verrucomicrobiota bacterium]